MARSGSPLIFRVSKELGPRIAQHLARCEAILRERGADEVEIACVLHERMAEMAGWYLAALTAAQRDETGIGAN